MGKRLWVALLQGITAWLIAFATIADATTVDVVDAKPYLQLTSALAVLEDPTLKLSLNDVRSKEFASKFTPSGASGSALSYGYTKSAYWLRLEIKNSSSEPVKSMLEIAHATLSNIQFFQPEPDGSYRRIETGLAQPFSSKPYPSPNYVFPITIPANEQQTFFIRVQATSTMHLPIRLWETDAFHAYERDEYMSNAWYFGMASAIFLFNLILYLTLRDTTYLIYIIYIASFAIGFASSAGFAHEFLWPNSGAWSDVAHFASYSISMVLLLLFTRRMLDTSVNSPFIDRALKALAIGTALIALIYLLTFQGLAKLTLFTLFINALVVFCVSIYFVIIKRKASAMFFFAAFVVLLIGIVISSLGAFGVLSDGHLKTPLKLGSVFDMVILAAALGAKFKDNQRQRTIAQEQALATEKRMVESLRKSERDLEGKVKERTEALMLANLKLEELSTTDQLTGIANRRQFDNVLASEWTRSQRTKEPLSLAILDVDFFKKFNDHYGHQAGDKCLTKVAEVLRKSVPRKGDLVARYGGEEFVFLAPNTSIEDTKNMAEKICNSLLNLRLPHAMSDIGFVTASIGIASITASTETSPELLIKLADIALYKAKESGRNCVAIAPS